jgi:hypothetical protein
MVATPVPVQLLPKAAEPLKVITSPITWVQLLFADVPPE